MGHICCCPCRTCGCSKFVEMLTGPFLPYIAVSIGLNVPAVFFGIQAGINLIDGPGRCLEAVLWLFINSMFAILHIIVSIYVVQNIRDEKDDDWVADIEQERKHYDEQGNPKTAYSKARMHLEKSYKKNRDEPRDETDMVVVSRIYGNDFPGRSNSVERIKHVFCYDAFMSLYFGATVLWVLWLAIGMSRVLKMSAYGQNFCADARDAMIDMLLCGVLYLGLVVVSFMCSLSCLRCSDM